MADSRPRILLVDDEESILETYGEILERAGFSVQAAGTVEEARKCLSTEEMDAVLLDILLKGDSGLEILKLNSEIQPDTPVILMTGSPTVKTASDALRLGAYDYLCKPVVPEILLNVLERAVSLKSLREEKKHVETENQAYRKHLETLAADRAARLRLSEDRYRLLFESSKDAIYFCSREGRFLDFNPATQKLLGYPRGTLLAMDLESLYVDPAARARFQKAIAEHGYVIDFETRYRTLSGDIIDCIETATAVVDEDGRLNGYQGIIRNVTKFRAAERKIRKQNDFLNQVLESLAHPFLVVDAATYKIVMANSAAAVPADLPAPRCHQLFHELESPCGYAGLACPIDKVVQNRAPVRLEHTHHRPDGPPLICEIHGFPLMDANGAVDQVILYHLDISERVQAKRELQLLETAINQTADGVIITDTSGRIQYVNPGFEALSGYRRDNIDGQIISDIQTKLTRQPAFERMSAMTRRGEVWKGPIKGEKQDGTLFDAEVTVSPVKDNQGVILNFVGICRDVTEKHRLESIAEAANLMDNLGYIFSGIRHEIGNPLNSIKVALTVLLKNLTSYPTERVVEFLERSLSEILRVEYLLKALRNFSMFEHPDVQKINVKLFLKHFMPLVTSDFEKRGIRITADVSDSAGWAYTDTRVLHQVLLNLLTNAADALDGVDTPRIFLTIRQSGGLMEIKVRDNGQGMTPEQQQNLFKPFFTSKKHGTGLGLVIVKKMLAAMGSSIGVESTPGSGTTVTILIPGDTDG